MTQTRDLVTVIVPFHNCRDFLGHAISSVLAQSHQDWELILVDDGSTDDSAEAALPFLSDGRVSLVRQPNAGAGAARNAGFARASGASTFVVFLDGDDVLPPEFLVRAIEQLASRPDSTAVRTTAVLVDAEGHRIEAADFATHMNTRRVLDGRRFVPLEPSRDITFLELFDQSRLYPPACALIRTEAVRTVGGFASHLAGAEDWYFFMRLARLGPIAVMDAPQVSYRRHSSNATSDPVRYVRAARRNWSMTYHAPDITRAERRSLSKVWRARQRDLAQAKWHLALSSPRSRLETPRLRLAAESCGHLLLWRPPKFWMRTGLRRAVDAPSDPRVGYGWHT